MHIALGTCEMLEIQLEQLTGTFLEIQSDDWWVIQTLPLGCLEETHCGLDSLTQQDFQLDSLNDDFHFHLLGIRDSLSSIRAYNIKLYLVSNMDKPCPNDLIPITLDSQIWRLCAMFGTNLIFRNQTIYRGVQLNISQFVYYIVYTFLVNRINNFTERKINKK